MKIEKFIFFSNLWFLVLSLILLFLVFFVIDKGVDLTDEGLYISLSNPFQENKFSQFNYDLYFKAIYQFFNYKISIVGLRILKFSSLLISCILSYFILKSYNVSVLFYSILIFFSFSIYSNWPQSFSYNTHSYLVFILLLFLLSIKKRFKDNPYLFSICLAAIIILGFIGKSVFGIILFYLIIFIYFLEFRFNSLKYVLALSLFVLFGFWLLGLLYSNFNIIEILYAGFSMSDFDPNHNFFKLIISIISAFRWVLVLLLSGFLLNLFFRNFSFYVLGSSLILIIWFLTAHFNGTFNYYLKIIPFSFLYFVAGFFINFNFLLKNLNNFVFGFLCLFGPFIIWLGSDYYFFRGGVIYSVTIILFILINSFKGIKKLAFPDFVLFSLTSVLYLYIIFINLYISPFRINSSLNNLVEFNLKNGDSIFVPPNYFLYLTQLSSSFNKFVPEGNSITGMYQTSGDITLSGYLNSLNPCVWNSSQFKLYKSLENDYKENDFEYFLVYDTVSFSVFNNYLIQPLDTIVHYSGNEVFLIKGLEN